MTYKSTLLLGILLFIGLTPLFADTPPVMNTTGTVPKYYTETSIPVVLFPDFTITDAENDNINGLTISFTAGHHSDQDNLSFTNQNGISGSFNKSTGILTLTGTASPANYQTAVRSVTYSNDAIAGSARYDQRTMTISLANSDYFSQDGGLGNGHFYQVVLTAKGFYTSSSEASAKTYYGLQGYLATVTSSGENTFILNKIPSSGIGAVWLGGSDADSEGSWLWTGGPESGTKFYDKPTKVSTGYTNWYSATSEPNNDNGGEDCLLMYKSTHAGYWGDGSNTTSLSYIVEYGGTPGDPTLTLATTTTLNVVAPQPPVVNGNNDSPTYNTSDYNPVVVFPNFTVTDAENSDIKGLTIYFTSGYQSNQDVLRFTNTSKITGTFYKTEGALILSGDASPSEYQAAVRSITYVNNASSFDLIDGSQRQLTISLANADYFSQDSKLDDGHFYEYVNATITWNQAEAAASAKTYYGLQGYLATITSAGENSFIAGKISNFSWLGGSDRDVEGTWKWITGPEAASGTVFYTGGTAYNSSYVNWNTGEPSSSTTAEDYLLMYATSYPGKWNDINSDRTYAYVIEYGGMSGDPTINMTTTTTLNINVVRPEAPGGIVDNLELWLNAEKGFTYTSSTNAEWIDQSRNKMALNVNLIQCPDPGTVAPTLAENSDNFNSTLAFDGANTGLASAVNAANFDFSEMSVFSVQQLASGAYSHTVWHYDNNGSNDLALFIDGGSVNKFNISVNNATLGNLTSPVLNDDTPHLVGFTSDASSAAIYVDATNVLNAGGQSQLAANGALMIGLDADGAEAQDGDNQLKGNIGEVIMFRKKMSDLDRQEVESYLALKYGISLTRNYIASDGTTSMWTDDSDGYNKDIFGIGQDDASGLNQRVSRSVNNSNGPILAATADFTSSNFDGSRTGLGDGNFIMMAHNNGTENSFTSTFNSGTNNRSDRVWKVDETGTVGNVFFAIPKAAITFPSGIPVLVISNDEIFNSTDNIVNLIDDGTYYWASINPDNGSYISFATTAPGFTLSKSALTTGENAGTGTFTVVLDAQPSNNVVFNVTSDDTNEATVDKSTLTFTSANWNTPQTVTITGVDDNINRDDNATITISIDDASSDDHFDALEDQTVAVTLTNDDHAGFTVSESALTIDENSGVGSFTVVLSAEPTSDVVFDVTSSNISEAIVDRSTITFTSANWDIEQTVFVTGVDDAIDRDDVTTITVSVNDALSDDTFDALADHAVAITLTNDDVAPTVSTTTVSSVTASSVVMGGNVSDKGSAAVTETGVVYSSTNTSPEIDGANVTKDANGTYTGTYSESIGSLTPNTTYYFRAYAISSAGTSYGDVQSFTTKKTQIITFNPLSDKTYGDSDFDPAASASSGLTIVYSSSNVSVATIVNGKIHVVGAGSCTIYADQSGDDTYDAAPQVSQILTVNKATLTATAEDKSKTYGTANPELTISYSGFVGTDSKTDIDTEPTASTTATTASGAGTYPITVAGGADNNYDFSYGNGTLTVDKAMLTATADDKNKTYGTANPELTISYSGFVGTDSKTDIDTEPTASTTATTASGAGIYPITVAGGADNNYDFSYHSGTLTVNKAMLTATAEDKSKTYGAANPELTISYSGFVGTDSETVIDTPPTASTTATTTSRAGTYSIPVAGGVDNNYDFSYDSGTLTVNKAMLSIKADDKTKVYDGTVYSLFTVSYNGFVSGENENDLSGILVFSGTATTATNVGTGYVITPGGLTSLNYDITFIDGKLDISEKAQTISFDALPAKVFGDVPFNLTGTSSSGLAVNYVSSNTNVATISGNTVTIIGAGTTTIKASQPGNTNYSAATDIEQELLINNANQILTLNALPVGELPLKDFTDPIQVTATSSAGLPVVISLETGSAATLNVSNQLVSIGQTGNVIINVDQAGNSNYNSATIQYSFDVVKSNQSITFLAIAAQTYSPGLTLDLDGAAITSSNLHVSYSVVSGPGTISGTTLSVTGAGTIQIKASQAGNAEYNTATDVTQTATIKKATPVIVDFNNIEKIYGDVPFVLNATSESNGLFTYSSSNTDVAIIEGNTVIIVGTGETTLTASQDFDDNYTTETATATLTVNKADQTISFNPLDKKTDRDAEFQVTAISTSGLPVTFTSSDESVAICSGTNGSVISIIGTGDCIIYANQAGNSNYNAAPSEEQTLTVVKYIAGDTNLDGAITSPEIAGDTNGDGTIGTGEVAGDKDGDGTITSPEIAGDTNGDGTIGIGEIAGDKDGDGSITYPEIAGDTNGDGIIGTGEVAGDKDGDGTITSPEIAGDTNGDGTIDTGEVAGDTDGDSTITAPEIAGDTNGDGTIGTGEVAGDKDGDGSITSPEIAGDTNGDGTIDTGEVAGDTDGDNTITAPEIAGDTNGDGSIGTGEIAGDKNGDGTITSPEIAGDTNGDGTIGTGEIAGDKDGDGTIIFPEIAGDTNGDGTIDNGEIAGDKDGDGTITFPEIAGDTNGDGTIGTGEVAGDKNGDGTITSPEIAGDTNGNGQINNGEVPGNTNTTKSKQMITFGSLANKSFGDSNFNMNAVTSSGLPVSYTSSNESVATISGNTVTIVGTGITTITAMQSGNDSYYAASPVDRILVVVDYIAGDTNHDGKITSPEIAGDTNGDGKITSPEIMGDTNGNGVIDGGEIAGDENGDGNIGSGEIAGETGGSGTTIAGDTNGDGKIDGNEIAGDSNGDGKIASPEILGDTNGDGKIDGSEIAGDANGNGQIDNGETAGNTEGTGSGIAGDINGDGKITAPEVAGDTNGDGQIDNGEIAGDTDGDGKITSPEKLGDTNGNGVIDGSEIAGDSNGDGTIGDGETAGNIGNGGSTIAGDLNGDGKIDGDEIAGDANGDGQIGDGERTGDMNGDGQITAPEIAGDANGNGVIDNSEIAEGTIANIIVLSVDGNTYENPDSEIYYLIDCGDESNKVNVNFTLDVYTTTSHAKEFNMEIPGPGIYKEKIDVTSEDGSNTRTYNVIVEKRFNYENIVIQKYNNVLLINNNPDTNGGYHFVAFNWYRDGQLVGTGQYYSAGDNASDRLDLNAQYSIEVETENGDQLHTCDFPVSYTNTFSLKVAPNPVVRGSIVNVVTTYTTDMLADLKITVRNLSGGIIMQEKSGSNTSKVALPRSMAPGTYLVTTQARGVELSAKIVVQ